MAVVAAVAERYCYNSNSILYIIIYIHHCHDIIPTANLYALYLHALRMCINIVIISGGVIKTVRAHNAKIMTSYPSLPTDFSLPEYYTCSVYGYV